ncbi:unnamed protein product [Acanthoscelides obtectus]|uniref:Uncharacterized protein n=1 Tax=Acanthoscelides obtectus TaxID=200917 RepID=A0A9P0LSM5_ACAOB|nr:unnamed protein product [Acanthoscelides obtectus]CAH2012690.1 unnamed protein product [Acanthoscelides obtectus]CAK1643625.1 hypothetical protein AOBTE_LOCUS13609 [Acanthoscelides obtectus]CAK1643637.1 hypothetical protein AOBTE_LOCUS13615 [Acanthoscelides obtectus]
MQLGQLREEVCEIRRAGQAYADTHGREELCLSSLQ